MCWQLPTHSNLSVTECQESVSDGLPGVSSTSIGEVTFDDPPARGAGIAGRGTAATMREARADGATSAPQEEADMPLVLTNQDQERAFVVAEAIEAMASGLRQLAHGDATRRPRIDNYCPTGRPGEFLNFSSMEGVVRDPGYYALRIKPDVMSWPLVDGIRRKH